MRLVRLAGCSLALGCAAPVEEALPDAEPAPTDTAPPFTSAPPPPAFDAAGVEAEAAALLPWLPNAADVLQDWRDQFIGVSQSCPGITAPFSIVAPFEGCRAADGRLWAGYAVYTEGTDAPLDVLLEADATVTQVDGATFIAAGKTSLVVTAEGAFDSAVSGTWGGAGDDDWTGPGPSVAVWAVGDATSVALTGGMSLAGGAVYLSEVAWDAETCPGATGEIAVRDPGGWWYSIHLDEDCSGCGPLTYVGEDLGRACVGLGSALEGMVTATLAGDVTPGSDTGSPK
ncbi:MAG: hypothetical protein V4850_07240 [Myxococcota bacterium]